MKFDFDKIKLRNNLIKQRNNLRKQRKKFLNQRKNKMKMQILFGGGEQNLLPPNKLRVLDISKDFVIYLL